MVSTRCLLLLMAAASAGLFAESPVSPSSPLSPETKADILMARKMYREAIDVYSRVPDNSAIRWNKIGIAYHQLQDYRAAKKNYEEALKRNPRYGEALNNIGTIYYSQKSYGRAIKHYKKALRYLPESASIFSNLGTAYFAKKDYKRASESYQHALLLDPEVFEHRNTYGVMLQENNVAERAKFHYYLARTYAKAGMNERALQYVRKALEEGFTERDHFLKDPEFAILRTNQEFIQIVNSEPRVL
jgi:tetratricopeptide (TPR) repeat protein